MELEGCLPPLPPSTKVRWDTKLRIIDHLRKIIPIQTAVVEDVRAVAKLNKRRWNMNFSPIEAGKQYFDSELEGCGLRVVQKGGYEMAELREGYGLSKTTNKANPVFEAHAVDAWVLAASVTDVEYPITKSLYYLVPIRWHRRQLHRLEPEKGGIRKKYGGTMSLRLKRSTLIEHAKHGLCYIGGNIKNRFSPHSLTGVRLTQSAKPSECRILTKMAFRARFLPRLKSGVPSGKV